jgi:hypothetical protein
LPADWKPSLTDLEFCKTSRPELNPFDVADCFVDYWIAQPGAKGRKADWSATWRVWIAKERVNGFPSANHLQQPRRSSAVESGLALAGYGKKRAEVIDV